MISVLLQVFALALPILTGALVDRVVPRSDYGLLMVLGGALTAFIVFHFLSSLIRAHLLLHVRTLVDARMTLGFVEHLAALPYGFFQQRLAGDLMMRLNSNASVREIITSGVLSAFLDGGFVALYLLILFAISPAIAIVAMTLGALQVAIVLLTWRPPPISFWCWTMARWLNAAPIGSCSPRTVCTQILFMLRSTAPMRKAALVHESKPGPTTCDAGGRSRSPSRHGA